MEYQFTSHSENTSFSFARSIKFPSVQWNAILKLSHNYTTLCTLFSGPSDARALPPFGTKKQREFAKQYFRIQFIIPQKLLLSSSVQVSENFDYSIKKKKIKTI